MRTYLDPQHVIWFFGGAVIAICALTLGIYFLQRSLGRTLKPQQAKPDRVDMKDEAAFTLATVKGVLTQLKADQKVMQEKLIAEERRAEENTRKFELLAREIEYGLLVFNAEGYVTFSNPLVRKLLAVDTWSRRRHGEIFQDIPVLAKLIAECFETGSETRKTILELQGNDGRNRHVEVSVLQTRDRTGALEIVACMFREVAPPVPGA
jgi:PAS domain-containing protein